MKLSEWLKNPNRSYKDGLKLYDTLKKNKEKDEFFRSVDNPKQGSLHFNLLDNFLKHALRKMPPQKPATEAEKAKPGKPITAQAKTPSTTATTKFVFDEIVDVTKLPQHAQELYFRNQEITKQVAGMHAEMRDAKDGEKRKTIAQTIDLANKERQENWKVIKEAAGEPEKAPNISKTEQLSNDDDKKPSAGEVLDAQKRINTVRINITRTEKELTTKNLSDAKRREKSAKIEAWKIEMVQLKKIISKV